MIQGKKKKMKIEQIFCGVKINSIFLKNLKNTK